MQAIPFICFRHKFEFFIGEKSTPYLEVGWENPVRRDNLRKPAFHCICIFIRVTHSI